MFEILAIIFIIWAFISNVKDENKKRNKEKELNRKIKELEFEKRQSQGLNDIDYLSLPNDEEYKFYLPTALLEDFRHHCSLNKLNEWSLLKSYMISVIQNKKSNDNGR